MPVQPSASRISRWRAAGVAALTLALTGCPIGPDPGPTQPPVIDDGDRIERDPACKLTGSLELELVEGNGPYDFKPLVPGQGPTLHHGPQGGTHVEVGVRVANPANAYPGLQVKFTAESESCGTSGCAPFGLLGQYSTVIRDPGRFLPQEGGATVVSGFLLIVSGWPQDTRRRITVEALDRCDRTGTAVWELAAGTP